MIKKVYKSILMLVALFALGTSQAAAECKGSSKSACSTSNSCTWVSGYTKQDGNKVRGYCRAKGKSGDAAGKNKDKKSKSKSSDDVSKKDKKSKDKKSKDKKSKDKKSKDKKSKDKKSKDKNKKDKKSKDKNKKDKKSKDNKSKS